LYHDDEQRAEAEAYIKELTEAGVWDDPIVTQVVPLTEFWPAEDYHNEYFRRNPNQGYCRLVIAPKVAAFRQRFATLLNA